MNAGLFNFTDLTVVGKRDTAFDGVNYYYFSVSNGEKVVEFSTNKETYDSIVPFSKYSGSFDFANKKLKIVTLNKSK